MSAKIEYTPLSGGLDLVSGALNVKPGRLSECLNFEQVFGRQGYRRIDGYERFDGRPEPHLARYSVVAFKLGQLAVVAGDAVSSGAATAKVLKVTLMSGAWAASSAAGYLVVEMTAGVFSAGSVLTKGGANVVTVDGQVVDGSLAHPQDDEYQALASNARRAVIQAVPGSGPVRGVAVYSNTVYAARDAADGKTAALYRSSASGWQLVKAGLVPGGSFQFAAANFSGAADKLYLYGVDGKNRPFRWDGTSFTRMKAIQGTHGSSASSVAIGTGAKVFVVPEAARAWTVGQDLVVYSADNYANRMQGTVSSYTSGSLTVAVIDAQGSGTFTDWLIGPQGHVDEPYLLAEHKDHLWLAYPKGQLQTSNLGDPMVYSSTAALFGMGDEITGLVSMRGATLGVTCTNSLFLFQGSSSANWQREKYSASVGAIMGSAQENSGNALFVDDRGLTSLQATQNYGRFEPAIFSREVKPWLDIKAAGIVASRIAKTKFQYRLYFKDGQRLTAAIMTPNAVVQPQDVSFTLQQYPHPVTCTTHGDVGDEGEAMFFGTEDGFVMREDVGTSFDGAAISAVMRLHFNHLKSPSNKKRFRKLDIELDARKSFGIKFRAEFDYADGMYAPTLQSIAKGSGGRWDASNWDEFLWSMPVVSQAETNIDGIGRNIGLLIWHESAVDHAFSLHGLMLQYSVLGLVR